MAEYFQNLLDYPVGGNSFTPPPYSGNGGKFIRIKPTEDGLESVSLTGAVVVEETRNPLITDYNYNTGTIWINTSTNEAYVITDNLFNNAAWRRLTSDMVYDDSFFLDGNQISESLVAEFMIPYDGFISAFAVRLASQRTAGTLDVKLAKGGLALPVTSLNIQFNGSILMEQSKTIDYGTSGFEVYAGDRIGIIISSSSFAPMANKANLTLIIKR